MVNLNPQLPSNYSEYKETLQIVIKDNSTNQEIARESYKKCLGDGIKPKYVEEYEESFWTKTNWEKMVQILGTKQPL